MKKLTAIVLCTAASICANAQWEITTGPSSPNVTTLEIMNEGLYAGGSTGSSTMGGFRTYDDGDTWALTGTNSNAIFKCYGVNLITGAIYAGSALGFYQSVDNGETYTNTSTGLSSNNVNDIFVDGLNIYAASADGIDISTNGALNWSPIIQDIFVRRMDKSGNTIIAGAISTGVHFSTDNGAIWANPIEGLPNSVNDVKIVGPNFLLGTNFGTYISTDNGETWTVTELTFTTNCFHQIGSTVFAGTTDEGVFYSTDGGLTWTASSENLSNMTVFSLAHNETYLFAGTTGSVFRRPLSDFDFITSVSNRDELATDIVFAPNPSNGIFTISLSDVKETPIEVYNIAGQLVYTNILTSKMTTVDLSNQPKGIYFVGIGGNKIGNYKIVIH